MQAEARAWNRRKCSKCGLRDCAAAGEWWSQPANGGIKKELWSSVGGQTFVRHRARLEDEG